LLLDDLVGCRLLNVWYTYPHGQEVTYLLFEKDNGDVFRVTIEGENSGCVFTMIRKIGKHQETMA
jgi:hypothetical protein